MKKRTYRRTPIKDINVAELIEQLAGGTVVLAVDVAKHDMVAAIGCAGGEVVRTLAWRHPVESPRLLAVIEALQQAGKAVQAVMEPSGSYGDALRYQLGLRGVTTYRVSSKRTHDAAEVFDAVPSMHDAKAASILFRLHAQGLSRPWLAQDDRARELRAALALMELHYGHYLRNLNVLESVLARHWPELLEALELTSASLLVLLREMGSAQAVASSPAQARSLLHGASRGLMRPQTIDRAVASASRTLGEPLAPSEALMLAELAAELHRALIAYKKARGRVELLSARTDIEPMASAVGKVTALVLVSEVGHPSEYASAAAYVKAMGLNLKERSSGMHRGRLSLSRRGSSKARKYLWFAVLRWVQSDPVAAAWYRQKLVRDGGAKMRALSALMRKLAKALYHVGRGHAFDSHKLFDATRLVQAQAQASATGEVIM